MQVTAQQIFKVEIGKEEQRRIAIQTIRNAAKWVSGNFVSDGKLMLRENYATSHSWSEDLVVRDATPLELATDVLIKHILSSQSV
jgi:hypothetical protein